jgi:hypothetical protein
MEYAREEGLFMISLLMDPSYKTKYTCAMACLFRHGVHALSWTCLGRLDVRELLGQYSKAAGSCPPLVQGRAGHWQLAALM